MNKNNKEKENIDLEFERFNQYLPEDNRRKPKDGKRLKKFRHPKDFS